MDEVVTVLAGSASTRLAQELAKEMGATLGEVERRRFPDGEGYVRILPPLKGHHVVIVAATAPDANLVELLLLQDAAREAGAHRVTTVIPYYAYSRQDQVFHPGEAVSARAVARALYATANELLIVDPHKLHILDFFPGVSRAVSAVPQLAAQLGAWGVDAVLAPDKGARDRAEAAATLLGVPCDHLQKTRLSATEVRIAAKDLDVAGKRVAILDDMIASGSTMLEAAKQLKAQGAKAVYAACTHGIFTPGAVERLLAGGIDRVLCTDTVEGAPCDVVSAAPSVAASIQGLTLNT